MFDKVLVGLRRISRGLGGLTNELKCSAASCAAALYISQNT